MVLFGEIGNFTRFFRFQPFFFRSQHRRDMRIINAAQFLQSLPIGGNLIGQTDHILGRHHPPEQAVFTGHQDKGDLFITLALRQVEIFAHRQHLGRPIGARHCQELGG